MTRAIIYARYSSDLQSDASIEDQVRRCRAKAISAEWEVKSVFTDHALSGASSLRPGYQSMLEAVRSQGFDILIAEALDRLSRDLSDIAALFKQLSFQGIRLVTLAEGEISDLHIGLKGTMNALFLKDLADKTRRGLEGRIRKGMSGGGNAYGYDVVKKTDENGEPVRGLRQINEQEAAIVRRIADEFIAGRSPDAIAKRLNRDGISGPRGKNWQGTAIRGHRSRGTGILNNELYIGRLVWNRRRYVKDPSTGKRVGRTNAPDQWIVEEVPNLRIISDDVWHMIKERQGQIAGTEQVQKLKATRFWEHRRSRHMLTGKVICGTCGSAMASIGKDYLGCNAARKQGTCTNKRSVRRDTVEAEILTILQDRLMQPEHIEEFIAAYNAEISRMSAGLSEEHTRLEQELRTTKKKLDGLYDAIADGLRSDGLQSKLSDLEDRKKQLMAKLEPTESVAPVALHPNLARLYRQKVNTLSTCLKDDAIRDEALTIIQGLVDQVTITPLGPNRNDGWTFDLDGEIVHMVALANTAGPGYDKAALNERTACSVKVVAGRGFEPLTFRL
jgi:DNA invertase Pin-like site-specific DNA recombinase